MIKNQITIIFIFALVILTLSGVSATDVTGCTQLGSGNFLLTVDLNCANDGMQLNGDNTIFDCQGHTINYSSSGAENDRGIEFWGTHTNITVKNCIVKMTNTTSTNLYRQGITLYDNSNATIYNTTVEIWGAYIGIEAWGTSGATMNKINVSNSRVISHNGDGIAMEDYAQNAIIENTNITVDGWGIFTWAGANNIQLKNNIINATSPSYGAGIYLQGTISGTNITGNTIYSEYNGITILSTATQTNVANNQLLKSANRGISIESSGNVLSGNTISGAGVYGLYFANSSTNVSTSVISSTNYPLYLTATADDTRIISSNISRSSGSAIDLLSGADRVYFDNVQVVSGTARGFYLAGTSNNLTILNSNITSVTEGVYVVTGGTGWNLTNNIVTSGGSGFSFTGVTNSYFGYNNITTSGSSAYGVSLDPTSNGDTFSNNILRTTGSASHAFAMSGSDNNIISRLNVTTTGESAYGILVTTPDQINMATGNVFSNSSSLTGGSASASNLACALYLLGNNNNFTNLDLKTTGGNGTVGYAIGAPALLIRNSSNNYLKDITMNAVNAGDIMARGEASYTSYFINVSYNEIAFNTAVAFQKQYLDFSWYVDVNVKNSTTGLNLQNVNVTIYNVSTIPIYSQLTDANGNINQQTVKAFLMNGTTTISYTPHNITANLSGYNLNSSVFNLTSVHNVNWLATLSASPSADTTPPYFTYIPPNTSITYTQGFGVDFNATDAVGFGTYAINWTTLFSINSSGWLKNSTPNIAVGVYLINVTINDTSNNLNSTIYMVNVSKATPTLTYFINSQTNNISIVYPQQVNASAYTTGGTVAIYRDNVNKTSENGLNVSLAVGNYTYIFNVTGNANYTDVSSKTMTLNITKAGNPVTLLLNGVAGNLSITYPQQLNATANSGVGTKLYRNGTDVTSENKLNVSLSAGYYSYLVNATGNANYSANSTGITYYANISKGTSQTSLTFDKTSPQTYGTAITPTCSIITGQGSAVLTMNGSVITSGNALTLGAGTYSFNCSLAVSTNYTYSENVSSFTIDKKVPTGSLASTGGWTLTYPTETTISLSESNTGDGGVTYIIYRDGVSISTGETITLGYGTYNYVLNTTGGANYTANASMDAETLTVNKNAGACAVLFNETSPLTYPATFKVYSNCNSAFTLYRNGTIVANNSEQSLEAGIYNFTVQRTDTSNYSNVYDEELFTIVQNIPTIYFVEQVSAVTLNGGTTKTVQVLFNVSYSNVKSETANVSFSKAGETTRYASSCNNNTFSNQFNCSVNMQFYDSAGADWLINATINSTEDDIMSNSSIQFTVNSLDYITQDTSSINWSSIYANTNDNEADFPINLTNGGNQNYNNISLKAYNSTGAVESQVISASSFSVDALTGQTAGQTYMSEGVYVQALDLTGLNSHGVSVIESIYFYVDLPTLKADTYTSDSGWVIKCSA